MLSLVNHSSDPWHIYAVTTEPDQVWSLYAVARTRTDVEEMREKEARRLELSFALRLLKKANKKAATRTFKRGRGRGSGRGRGRGRRQHNDTDSIDLNSGEEEDPPTEADEGGPPLPPPAMAPPPFEQSLGSGASASSSAATPLPLPPPWHGPGASSASSSSSVPPPPSPFLGVPARRRARVGSAWGRNHWEIAPIRSSDGSIVGCGATCNDHVNVGDTDEGERFLSSGEKKNNKATKNKNKQPKQKN